MSLSLHVRIYKTDVWSFRSVSWLYLAILLVCIINFKGQYWKVSPNTLLWIWLQNSSGNSDCNSAIKYIFDDACIICMHCVCLHTYCLVCTHCVSCMFCVSRACTRCICILHALRTHSLFSDILFFHGKQHKLDLFVFFSFLGGGHKGGGRHGKLGKWMWSGCIMQNSQRSNKNILEK